MAWLIAHSAEWAVFGKSSGTSANESDEPMTGPQRSYLQTLCREAGEELDQNWTKAEASKKIEELQQKTGRGKSGTRDS
jgi:uncharacterized damage-inducible protein DinB